jgi:hypothetical protein
MGRAAHHPQLEMSTNSRASPCRPASIPTRTEHRDGSISHVDESPPVRALPCTSATAARGRHRATTAIAQWVLLHSLCSSRPAVSRPRHMVSQQRRNAVSHVICQHPSRLERGGSWTAPCPTASSAPRPTWRAGTPLHRRSTATAGRIGPHRPGAGHRVRGDPARLRRGAEIEPESLEKGRSA